MNTRRVLRFAVMVTSLILSGCSILVPEDPRVSWFISLIRSLSLISIGCLFSVVASYFRNLLRRWVLLVLVVLAIGFGLGGVVLLIRNLGSIPQVYGPPTPTPVATSVSGLDGLDPERLERPASVFSWVLLVLGVAALIVCWVALDKHWGRRRIILLFLLGVMLVVGGIALKFLPFFFREWVECRPYLEAEPVYAGSTVVVVLPMPEEIRERRIYYNAYYVTDSDSWQEQGELDPQKGASFPLSFEAGDYEVNFQLGLDPDGQTLVGECSLNVTVSPVEVAALASPSPPSGATATGFGEVAITPTPTPPIVAIVGVTSVPTPTPKPTATSQPAAPKGWCRTNQWVIRSSGFTNWAKVLQWKDLYKTFLDLELPVAEPETQILRGTKSVAWFVDANHWGWWRATFDSNCPGDAWHLGQRKLAGIGLVDVFILKTCGNPVYVPLAPAVVVTATPLAKPTPTVSPSATRTPTVGPSPTPKASPTPTVTLVATSTKTPVPTGVPTNTPVPSLTFTQTSSPTPTFTPSPTSSPTPTNTPVVAFVPSATPTPCWDCQEIQTPVNTPVPQSATNTPVSLPSDTPSVATPGPTVIASPTPSVP